MVINRYEEEIQVVEIYDAKKMNSLVEGILTSMSYGSAALEMG